MRSRVLQLIDDVIVVETGGDPNGGYTNHPDDPGGPTRWGVTEAVARASGYTGDMRAYPHAAAVQLYLHQYVRDPGFGRVMELSPMIGGELVEAGINLGPRRPSRWLQDNLNLFNRQERDYPDIADDGIIGNRTITALTDYLHVRSDDGDEVLTRTLNVSQGAEYQRLARAKPFFETFYYGWMRKRVRVCPERQSLKDVAC